MSIGTRIRLFREQLGLSQTVLAERLGLRQEYVSQMERDHSGRGVSLKTLDKFADAFGVPTIALIDDAAFGQHVTLVATRIAPDSPAPAQASA